MQPRGTVNPDERRDTTSCDGAAEAALEQAPIAFVATDARGAVTGCNHAARELLGRTLADVLGRPLAELLPDRATALHASGERIAVETRFCSAGPEGPPIGVFLRDLRAEDRTRAALAAAEQRIALLDDVTDQGIVVVDNGVVTEVNAAMTTLFRATREQLCGTEALRLVADADRERLRNRMVTGEEGAVEFRALRLDGTTFDALGRSRQIELEGRTRRVATVQDVSELRRAQHDLQYVVDVMPVLVAYWDPTLHNRMANRAHIEWFNKTPKQLLGTHLSEMIDAATWDAYIPLLRRTLAGETMSFDAELTNAAGEVRQIHASYIPDIVEGEVRGFLVMAVDIDERKKAEMALAAALKDLERSNRDLRDFAAHASHDLQAPLRRIGKFSRALDEDYRDVLDDEGRTLIRSIEESVQRLQDRISAVLAYARVGARGATGDVQVQAIIEQARQNVSVDLEAASGEMHVTGAPASLWGNAEQLLALFQNLFSNAIKFRGPRPLRIDVAVETSTDAIEVTVSDNGIGLGTENTERLFEMFTRVHAESEYAGHGVGLAICRRAVEAHGGSIVARTAQNGGTSFHVRLPRRSAAPTATTP